VIGRSFVVELTRSVSEKVEGDTEDLSKQRDA
jgi:hypothetical protein